MDKEYITIDDKNIEMNFYVDGEEYVVLNSADNELDKVYLAKVVTIDEDIETLVSLTNEEYDKALEEYISILELELEDEDNEN